MRTVYHAETIIDAHLVKDALEADGIPAFVAGEYLMGGIGQLPPRDLLTVMVPDSCIEQALPRVREMEALLSESRTALESDMGGDDVADWPGDGIVYA